MSHYCQEFRDRSSLSTYIVVGLLICTLISENQGLAKLKSVSNLRKISGPAHLEFFFSLSTGFFSGLWYKFSFSLGGENPGLQDLKFF